MTKRLTAVFSAIDDANSADPTMEQDGTDLRPAALLYGLRMSSELGRICPQASEVLQIAARGQHIERWKTPRDAYPEGRAGYFAWRKAQAAGHGARLAELMAATGYHDDERARVESLLKKENLKGDSEVQMLEDVICLVFLRWYFAAFAEGRESEQIFRIVSKTARKMSVEGRARVAAEFDLPDELAPALAV